MEERYFSGEDITIECTNFRNPIYQSVWTDFIVRTYDSEDFYSEIESGEEGVGLDATTFSPALIDPELVMIQPDRVEIGTLSTWEIVITMPIPMEEGCWIKLFVPSDLTFQLNRIQAGGFFLPANGAEELSTSDYSLNRQDDPSPSIQFRGCNSESTVGESPSGKLEIDSISTPLSIRDSGEFYVYVYKDENLSN